MYVIDFIRLDSLISFIGTLSIVTLPLKPLFLPVSIDATVDFPQPLLPTIAVKLPRLKFILTLCRISLFSSYEKQRLLHSISILSVISFVAGLLSSISSRLKILSLAAIPFIAMWKKLPSWRIGMKKSADRRMIKRQPDTSIFPHANCVTARIIPTAAPPYAIKSIIVMELSCIVRTFIVIFLNFSASIFISSFLNLSDL